jgi:hypothetical protein
LILDSLSVAGDATAPTDRLTHGPAMAETLFNGLATTLDKDPATSVRVLPVDVYGNNPTTSAFDVALGIYRAVEKGAQIINLSMGTDGDSPVLHEVIANSQAQGVVFFAAAGNEPVNTPTYPAAYPGVVAVTAVDRSGNIASYANYGSFVQAGGPGTVPVTLNNQTYLVSGTSPSTAYVSGVAAGLAEKTGRSPSQVAQAIPSLMPVKKP